MISVLFAWNYYKMFVHVIRCSGYSQNLGTKLCNSCSGWYSRVYLDQWRSQDEQFTWAQHGHTQCVCNTHLLGDLGHAPAVIASEAVFGHKYNSFSLTCTLVSCPHEICDPAPANFTWAQARVCPGVATPLIWISDFLLHQLPVYSCNTV